MYKLSSSIFYTLSSVNVYLLMTSLFQSHILLLGSVHLTIKTYVI